MLKDIGHGAFFVQFTLIFVCFPKVLDFALNSPLGPL